MTDPSAHHPARRAALGFIFVTLLLDVLGFGILIPVSPKLVQHLLGDVSETAASPYYGWLAASYAVMQFIFSPTLGALSDRFGRRPVLLVAIFGSGIDYIAMALSPTLWFLFFTRAINGLSGASMTVCSAYVADVTPPQKRAAAFGMLGAAFGVGFILGPLMGGLLSAEELHIPLTSWVFHGDIRYPFWAAAVLCLGNWLYGYFVLPESLDAAHRSHVSLKKTNPVAVFKGIWHYPAVVRLGLSLFFLNLGMFVLHGTWALSMAMRYRWTSTQIGLSLAIVGLGAAIVQGGLARKIIPRLGERKALLFGLLTAVIAYLGYGAAPEGWMIYAIVAFASIGGIASPAAQSLITRSVKATEQGRVQGALTSAANVAQIIGIPCGALVFAHFAKEGAVPRIPGAAFYLSATCAAVGTAIAWWATSPSHPHPPDAAKA